MTVPDVVPEKTEYTPTPSQLERGASIKRFNRLFVYLPISFFSVVAILITILMLYLSLNPPTDETLLTISGIADAVVILGTIPAIIVCGIFPALFLVAVVQARQRGMAPLRQLQTLFWRMDSGIGLVRQKVNETAPKIARPFIVVYAKFAYFQALIKKIPHLFRRS
jgi:hypothetical protein